MNFKKITIFYCIPFFASKLMLSFIIRSKIHVSHKIRLSPYNFCSQANTIGITGIVEETFRDLDAVINLSSSRILLNVSGGSDSMAMLHVFASIQQFLCSSLKIEVVHFNHKFRVQSDEEVL